jgi:hypothetical protein
MSNWLAPRDWRYDLILPPLALKARNDPRSAAMSVTTSSPRDILEIPPVPVRRFTVDEYHHMIRAGFFADDERFELLEGWIVPKMIHSPLHETVVVLPHEQVQSQIPDDWRIRMKSGITTGDSEPEPDLALVRGAARDYISHHPGPNDVALAIEVADASLAQDRSLKARLYARASVPTFWIINLIDAKVEVYSDPTGPDTAPRYRQQQEYRAGDSISLVIAGQEVGRIDVRAMLP